MVFTETGLASTRALTKWMTRETSTGEIKEDVMKYAGITREELLEAAKGAATVTEVARKLGICGKTMSGRTGKLLRSMMPDLDSLLKNNAGPKATASTESPTTVTDKATTVDCPYSRGLYRALFIESTTAFRPLDVLIRRLTAMGHRESAVRYAWAVLKNPNHASNGKRSTLLDGTGNDEGKVKLICLKRKPTGAC